MKRSTIRTICFGTGGFSTFGALRLLGWPMHYRPQFWWLALTDMLVLCTFVAALGYLFFTRNRHD